MPGDPVSTWIRLDKVTRRLIGWRMEHGSTPETDEAIDKLKGPAGVDGPAAGEREPP